MSLRWKEIGQAVEITFFISLILFRSFLCPSVLCLWRVEADGYQVIFFFFLSYFYFINSPLYPLLFFTLWVFRQVLYETFSHFVYKSTYLSLSLDAYLSSPLLPPFLIQTLGGGVPFINQVIPLLPAQLSCLIIISSVPSPPTLCPTCSLVVTVAVSVVSSRFLNPK